MQCERRGERINRGPVQCERRGERGGVCGEDEGGVERR